MPQVDAFEIIPRAPYAFDLTAARFGRFASEIVDLLDGKQYRRLLAAGRQLALATVTDVGTVGKPRLMVELRSPSKAPLQREAFEAQVRHILCTDLDLKPFYRLARSNELLAPAVKRFRGLRLAASQTLFEALVGAVLSQQVNLTFAHSIKRELVERFGRTWRVGGRTYWAFPAPRCFAEQSVEALRPFRLSNAKAGALVRLGEAFASSTPFPAPPAELDSLSDDDLIERLTALKGIGRWTAETALVRGLIRPDVFPAGDLAVVKYLAQSLLGKTEKASEAEMRAFAEAWRPYRGLAPGLLLRRDGPGGAARGEGGPVDTLDGAGV